MFLLTRERVTSAEDMVVVGSEGEEEGESRTDGVVRTLPVTYNHELVTPVTRSGSRKMRGSREMHARS